MSYEIPGFTRSYEAVVDLSGSYLRFIKKTGGLVVPITGATDQALGVLQNKPNLVRPGVFQGNERTSCTVMIDGVSRVQAGAAFAADAVLTIDASGRVVVAGAGARVVGVAEEASTGVNAIVAALLKPLGGVVA